MTEQPPADPRVAAVVAALQDEDPRPVVYLGGVRLRAELAAALGEDHPAAASGREALAYTVAARPLLNSKHGLSIGSRRDEYGRLRRVRLTRLENPVRAAA